MKPSDATSAHTPEKPTYAGLLARRAGLRQVRFIVPDRDYAPIAKAKRRFGTGDAPAVIGRAPLRAPRERRMCHAFGRDRFVSARTRSR